MILAFGLSVPKKYINQESIEIYFHKFVNCIPWKNNIRKNSDSGFSIVTMGRVVTISFELGIVNFHAKILIPRHSIIIIGLKIVNATVLFHISIASLK